MLCVVDTDDPRRVRRLTMEAHDMMFAIAGMTLHTAGMGTIPKCEDDPGPPHTLFSPPTQHAIPPLPLVQTPCTPCNPFFSYRYHTPFVPLQRCILSYLCS